jgi:hypothetical protein
MYSCATGPHGVSKLIQSFQHRRDDQFGYSVAVSGDTVVLGAIGEDSKAIGLTASRLITVQATPVQLTFSFGLGVEPTTLGNNFYPIAGANRR